MFEARFFCNQQNHSDWIPVPLVCFDYRTWRTPFFVPSGFFPPVRVNDSETCATDWSQSSEMEKKKLESDSFLMEFVLKLIRISVFFVRAHSNEINPWNYFAPPFEHQKTNYSAMLPWIPMATPPIKSTTEQKRPLISADSFCFSDLKSIVSTQFRKQMEKCFHKHPWFICLSSVRLLFTFVFTIVPFVFRSSAAQPARINSSSGFA